MYQPQDLAVYIHWPFCKSKCPYCDFYKQVNPHVNQTLLVDEYLQALQKYHELLPDRQIKSIFFGGGTPSLMEPQQIARILDFIAGKWSLSPQIEISLEANPNSHYQNMFSDFRNAGINRLSLGVQALNEADLRFLGRSHNVTMARSCLAEIVRVFDNHSADLIYARPQQNIAAWQQELSEICSYGLRHISLYQLTIEEGTIFARKNIQALDEDKAAEMYDFTRDFLHDAGYLHYEVSNFARAGYESRHNLTYWQGGDYLGIGASAHGRICLNGQHFATVYPFEHTMLTAHERARELILMGLRLTAGLNKLRFKQICGLDLTEAVNQEHKQNLLELGLLEEDRYFLRVTYRGMLVLNTIIFQLCDI